ncbi:MAG: nucleotidyltransferase domain-containing protein [Magnetococcales bacterium]|nr:nucleotidyltransferase domain-containing protein [Magnetococcales bacterium]
MSEPPLIDIRPDHWEIVRAILKKHLPDREVWAFGSRAKWTAKQYSDLDLALLGDEPLELGVLAGLEEDFSESDLPFKVDVVDWATTAEGFRRIIEKDRVVVQKGDIANILGALDDKIELNRRMNADLEAMARALFKDWFVDFGPVRAKAEGRPAYLVSEIWDLFPDALDDEDKPVGWEQVLIPSSSVLAAFNINAQPLFGRICQNEQEISLLAHLRDLLLPKLITGEIRVRDAERWVGETL